MVMFLGLETAKMRPRIYWVKIMFKGKTIEIISLPIVVLILKKYFWCVSRTLLVCFRHVSSKIEAYLWENFKAPCLVGIYRMSNKRNHRETENTR
jgi:hypothetical protein